MDSLEIYKKLKVLRKERGLTLNTFAEKIGSDYQQISRIERGKSKLTIDMLTKMANALETPLSTLIDSRVITKAPIQNKTPAPSHLQEELLPLIFGKIEMMLHKTNKTLSQNVKAALASKIYKQAASTHPEESKKIIDFSIEIIQTILQPEDTHR